MKAITTLAALALGGAGIAAGIAVAQPNAGTEATMNPDTANYGTPPGAPLKRDGSLSASGVATGTVNETRSSTWSNESSTSTAPVSSSTTTSTTTSDTSSQQQTVTSSNDSLRPRADRN